MASKASSTTKGQIGVTTENIFPVIKQFLYSDHEIFLRELVANAVDATQKLKTLAAEGQFKGELGEPVVRIVADEKAGTLQIIDEGVGMDAGEVERYINQIAFSSAGEFLEKYKDKAGGIIGHFGLGFYSAFMVASRVTLETLSWKEGAEAVKWTCDGSPSYEMSPCAKQGRGTVVTLYLDEDAKEFATKAKVEALLGKYCKFMPVPIVFGKEQEWKDGKWVDTDKDHVVNSVAPLWVQAPSELKEEDYMQFYRTLFPMNEDPLFHIHLNVDYPFHLTGILYFPKLKDRVAVQRDKVSLYCNRMFVTDHVENIVPEFMTLLHGVIDSPDIPLNVSRSYLQSDGAVKKISSYITKKVADRLDELFKEQRDKLEAKWDHLKLFIEYGMLSDEKFCERALKFALLKDVDGKHYSFEEYRKAVEGAQTDKDKKCVCLYATHAEEQYPFIQAAKAKGYNVLLMDCELDAHYVNLLERKLENVRFARVDSDTVENLIPKGDRVRPEMKAEDSEDLSALMRAVLPADAEYAVTADNLGADGQPILITQSEFMRRYADMGALGGGMDFYADMPKRYDVTVNMEHPLVAKVWEAERKGVPARAELPAEAASDAPEEEKTKAQKARQAIVDAHRAQVEEFAKGSDLLRQLADLALLSAGLLRGKALSEFIARSGKVVMDAYL